MKILVCIKQVIDNDSTLYPSPQAEWLLEDSDSSYRMNSYDEYALEEALLLKERIPGTVIHVISVGPERVTQIIRRAFSKGADYGVHIHSDKTPLSALETASDIACYAGENAFDLILTGVMSEDAMQCQVGPLLAALLSLPCAVSVVAANLVAGDKCVTVHSELEGMMTEKIIVSLPAVLTIQTGGNKPRYPSLSNILRAKEKVIVSLDAEGISAVDPREEFLPLAYPAVSAKGVVLTGTREEKAEQLLNILHERSLL